GEDVFLMFLTAITLAVAAIPEALPAVVTISLALGARKMVRQNALIRRLPAVETLGSITYICSDKTGTLTQNNMRVESFYVNGETVTNLPRLFSGNQAWQKLGECLALSNDVYVDEDQKQKGDPTELALFDAALKSGLEKATLEKRLPRIAELPFDAVRKRMTTLHQAGEKVFAFSKGSPEAIIGLCHSQLLHDNVVTLKQTELLDMAEKMAVEGFRVLALAYRELEKLPAELQPEIIEKDLIFIGLVALIDPPRPEAEQAVAMCKAAGITPVMITGDHPATAKAIALRLGIATHNDNAITGKDLQSLSVSQLKELMHTTRVFARVTPSQKIRIVEALQEKGEYVAMTGDGVNDAPALKRADIGVAMGLKGTDVAREAADAILLDDNFATIVSAIREGRRIYDNIRKFIRYVMTSNSGEILTLFLAPFLGLPIPLLPVHILWINLVTDGLPGLALAFEKHEPNIMQRPPRAPTESIFSGGLWQHALVIGLLIAGLSLFVQAWAYNNGIENWQTMVFTTLTFSQLVHSLAIRFERESIFSGGFFSNPRLLMAVVFTVILQLLVIYLPWCNIIFKTQPLSFEELLICFSLPWIVLIAVEIEKWFVRKHDIYG
ncbi:MAG: cation-transporting P-type ATPase, partial [Gammaproteobacteria bacterium]|nr:cation-transporting P-type ATPase [Gammaproteobacteria bacterium]